MAAALLAYVGLVDGFILQEISTGRRLGNIRASGKAAVAYGFGFLLLSLFAAFMARRAHRFEDYENE